MGNQPLGACFVNPPPLNFVLDPNKQSYCIWLGPVARAWARCVVAGWYMQSLSPLPAHPPLPVVVDIPLVGY